MDAPEARESGGIELELFDGIPIAEMLSDRRCLWIAERYLSLPSEFLLIPEAPSPGWFEAIVQKKYNSDCLTSPDFFELKDAVRFAVSQTHAVELHHLSQEAGAAFMRDAQKVSKALIAATGAVKLNYEIHGNSLPHLHMHFFPRYRGDRFEDKPIDPQSVRGPVYAQGDFQKIRDAFLLSLGFVPGQ